MKYSLLFVVLFVIGLWFGCNETNPSANRNIATIEISSEVIRNFISTVASDRNTDLILMEVYNEDYFTTYKLSKFYSTCQLSLGDQFGIMVGEEWMNVTPPLYRAKVDEVDVYIVSGTELLSWSAERYEYMLEELKDRVDRCVYAYDKEEDVFLANPPMTTLLMPWKIKLLKESTVGGEQTIAIIYEPLREGYDDFYYKIDTVRIATNYREKYFSTERN